MNKKYAIVAIVGLVMIMVAIAVALTHRPAAEPSSGKVSVVTSFYPLYFLAQEIGGDLAEVKNITPAGAEPHDYEPTAQDMAAIENSRLLILNGGGLEAWGQDMAKNINPAHTLLITAGEGLTTSKVTEDGKLIIDPHVWLSPELAQKMTDRVAQGLMQVDPAHRDVYQSNAVMLKNKLAVLDQEYRNGLAQCAKKDIVTSHAAFGYLAAAYGLRQVAIAGLSPDAEPSSKQLAEVVSWVKNNGIKYIFFESLVSPKLAETIAQEAGAQTLVLNPLEGLSADELSQGKNYFTVMNENLTNLRTALQCLP